MNAETSPLKDRGTRRGSLTDERIIEIAIATAVAIYGVGSYAALGTTMGLFWEVPIMLSLVLLGKALGRRGFWKQDVGRFRRQRGIVGRP